MLSCIKARGTLLLSLLLLGSLPASGNEAWLGSLLQRPPFVRGDSAGPAPGEGAVRHYYIAAEEGVWKFARLGGKTG